MVSSFDEIEYIGQLKQYTRQNFKYEISNHVIKMYIDNEIYYTFDCISMKMDMYERNTKTELGSFRTEKGSKANFAMLMRNVFNNGNGDIMPDELEKCNSLEELKLIFEKYLDNQYYSIGSIQTGKVSILLDGEYEILFGANNKNYSIDRDSDPEYIFGRFYNEVTYYATFMKNLKEYETIFNEKFSEKEIIDLIGY